MRKFGITGILLVAILPSVSLAADSRSGFFNDDVANGSFFSEDQAGIPIKNPNGNTTTRKNSGAGSTALEDLGKMETGYKIGGQKIEVQMPQTVPQADSFDYKEAGK